MEPLPGQDAKPNPEPELAASRGNPSFVWRAGQERRLSTLRQWVSLEGKRVLDVGCGIGLYTAAFGRFSPHAVGIELEWERVQTAREEGLTVAQSVGEALPFESNSFEVVFSHEVIEHVENDSITVSEMVRVAVPGGRIVIFCPNRWYPFETHGHYWKGAYHFGNTPLINYLPEKLRDRLAPHVRTYSGRRLLALLERLPVRVVHHTRVFPGYDNIAARRPALGLLLRRVSYLMENSPLRVFGLSHLLVVEKLDIEPFDATI